MIGILRFVDQSDGKEYLCAVHLGGLAEVGDSEHIREFDPDNDDLRLTSFKVVIDDASEVPPLQEGTGADPRHEDPGVSHL